jgi:hypothetical protein
VSDVQLTQETPEQAARFALNIYEAVRREGRRTTGEMFLAALSMAGYKVVADE